MLTRFAVEGRVSLDCRERSRRALNGGRRASYHISLVRCQLCSMPCERRCYNPRLLGYLVFYDKVKLFPSSLSGRS